MLLRQAVHVTGPEAHGAGVEGSSLGWAVQPLLLWGREAAPRPGGEGGQPTRISPEGRAQGGEEAHKKGVLQGAQERILGLSTTPTWRTGSQDNAFVPSKLRGYAGPPMFASCFGDAAQAPGAAGAVLASPLPSSFMCAEGTRNPHRRSTHTRAEQSKHVYTQTPT